MTTIEVLDPAGALEKRAPLQPKAVESLKGRRLAILDNGKPNFLRLATAVAQQLQNEFSIESVKYYAKENAAVGAAPETLDEIVSSCDLVLTGSAD